MKHYLSSAAVAPQSVSAQPSGLALWRLMAAHPKLTRWGLMNLSDPDYGRARAELAAHPEEFQTASEFIHAGMPGVQVARRYHSYSLKHRAEEWGGTIFPEWSYVSNGAMIAAALASGWDVKRAKLNAWLSPSASR
jgi:hypothetical protein